MNIESFIRDIPDFPKPGIIFKDITPLLMNPEAYSYAVNLLIEPYRDAGVTKIAGMESRGFLFGISAAERLQVGFIPLRKKGKLPYEAISYTYSLEYGEATLEMHTDAVSSEDRVLLVDDLLATGGTAEASKNLIEQGGGKVIGASFLIELAFLKGRDLLGDTPVTAPLVFD